MAPCRCAAGRCAWLDQRSRTSRGVIVTGLSSVVTTTVLLTSAGSAPNSDAQMTEVTAVGRLACNLST